MKRALLWFRNDLRLHDHPALQAALEQAEEIVPIYIIDERYLERDRWGFLRTGPYRLQFLLESLSDLRVHLEELGSTLVIRKGIPERELFELAKAFECDAVFACKEYAHEEVRMERAVAAVTDLHLVHNSTLYHPDDLPFSVDELPEVFTAFRKRVERYCQVRPCYELPASISSPAMPVSAVPTLADLGFEAPPPDGRSALRFQGGSRAAWERLAYYLWESRSVSTYKETRNGLVGADYSTRFSPWLANGSISPRAIYYEVEAYEAEVENNRSTYWVKFELLWRDYFKFVAMKHGRRIFFPGGIQEKAVYWPYNPAAFRKWIMGTTGDAFVDANMRELLLTGWMSNRGRQNVASFLVHNLQQDWRRGAAWFESLLLDYDVTSNYGNWMYAAGVGNDPRDRIFNTRKQADQYDRDGYFRDLWLNGRSVDVETYIDRYL